MKSTQLSYVFETCLLLVVVFQIVSSDYNDTAALIGGAAPISQR